MCNFSRYDFKGDLTAYGAGNDNTIVCVKAGPGTVFIHYGTNTLSAPPKRLQVDADTDVDLQKETYAMVSGLTADDFKYNFVSLKGK